MANEPISNDLPQHLWGRGAHGGPLAGAYLTFNISQPAVIASQTDLEVGAVSIPCDFRIVEISLSCLTSVGGSTRATVQITDGTNDIITTDTLLVSAGSAVINGVSTGLVEAQRNRTKADRLQVDVTTPTSEVVTDLNVLISGFVTGHIAADAAND